MGVLLGAGAQLFQPALWSIGAYAGYALAGLVLLLLMTNLRTSALRWRSLHSVRLILRALVLCGVALLVFALVGVRSVHYAEGALSPSLEGESIVVTGVIASLPQPIEQGVRFALRVESAESQGGSVSLPPRLELGWYRDGWGERSETQPSNLPIDSDSGGDSQASGAAWTPHAGERWRMTVRLKAPHGARNPQGFDYELRMWEQGVQATGYVRLGRKDAPPQRLDPAQTFGAEAVLRRREQVRDAILQQLSGTSAVEPSKRGDERASDVPGHAVTTERARAAGVVAALVTGDQRVIDQADWNVFRATGVSHLVSISGLHITLFAWLAAQLVGGLWRRLPRLCTLLPAPSAALLGGLVLASLYAVFSGWGIPAQRTVLMLAVVVALRLAGRRWPWPSVWLLACAAVVLWDPWSLLQAGFWLSFVAVGVLFAIVPIAVSTDRVSARARFVSIIRQQGIVTVSLAPLTLLLFGQVSLVGFVANLLAIPWVTMVVTPLAFAGLLWSPLWQLAAWAVQAMGWWLGLLAAFPAAQFTVASAPLWAALAAVAGGVLVAARLPWAMRLSGLTLCLPVLLWHAPRPATGQFELLAADIGQGNAVLLRTARHALLYDTGPRFSAASDAGERVLVPLLRSLGERLDLVMVSHRDNDHSGGAASVLAQQPQARLTGSIAGERDLLALRAWTPCVAGQHWEWDGVRFDVLHPFTAAPAQLAPKERPNAQSCVLQVHAANGTAALLVGDIERPQERALVERAVADGRSLKAQVLLVPHHGSKTSSSDGFLQAVQPHIGLVQAAYRSRFGHPAPEVVGRLQGHGVRVVDSAHCGAALWKSADPKAVACERQIHRRYWQHVPP